MLACHQRDSPYIVIHQIVVGEVVREKLMSIAVVRWDAWWLTREQHCDAVSVECCWARQDEDWVDGEARVVWQMSRNGFVERMDGQCWLDIEGSAR